MNGTIVVEARGQYGRITYHPKNDVAFAFADIAGTKTLTPSVLKTAREKLGFLLEIVTPVDPELAEGNRL